MAIHLHDTGGADILRNAHKAFNRHVSDEEQLRACSGVLSVSWTVCSLLLWLTFRLCIQESSEEKRSSHQEMFLQSSLEDDSTRLR